jgi:hypothetical protein
LDFSSEVMVLPAGITEISNFDFEAFLELWAFVHY